MNRKLYQQFLKTVQSTLITQEEMHKITLFLLSLLLISALVIAGCASMPGEQSAMSAEKERLVHLEEEWGIKVLGIRQTAAGRMLNFRYKITDPEKAAPLASLHVKPYIIDQKTGYRVAVPDLPKVGSLRQRSREVKPDVIYFVLFSNPGNFIKTGNRVTVVIGDFKAVDLRVE